VPSMRPLHHGALEAVVMCLTPFNSQKSDTSPFLKCDPPSAMNALGIA
jgi:hypothetical protein